MARAVPPAPHAVSEQEQDNSTLGSMFWIDALCIDQENLAERNHQVTQMGKIYASAYRVVSWLGWWDHTLDSSTTRDTRETKMAGPFLENSRRQISKQ